LSALTESNFKQQSKIGDYESKEFVKTQLNREYEVAIYKGKYSNEPKDVMISITFKNGDEAHKAQGLFMTSSKLASK
jgi:hypothetical protein